ncbi:MAG: LysM peptidoglycan-binding domain-containing protein [Phycisphaerae bacterium]
MRAEGPLQLRTWRVIALLASLGALAATGCFPSVRITRAECRALAQGEKFDGLAFVATVDTTHVVDQQLLYHVTLEDEAGNALRSRDGRYEDPQGRVAASKALMVLTAPWRFDDQTIAIPADELPLDDARGPLTAVFTIATPDGEVLAQQRASVPVRARGRAVAARPASATASPTGRAPGPVATPRFGASGVPPRTPGATASDGAAAPAPSATSRGGAAPRPIVATRPPPGAPDMGRGADGSRPRTSRRPASDRPVPGDGPSTRPSVASPGVNPRDAGGNAGDRRPALPPRAGVLPPRSAARSPGESPPRAARSAEQPGQPSSREASGDRGATTRPAAGVRVYTVRKGDSLAGIAKRELGSPLRWREIFDLNRDQLPTPDSLREGMELRLPAERAEGP